MSKYGVKSGDFGEAIYIGRVNKAQNEFTDKEDQTGAVLHAVAQWVTDHKGGDCWVNVGGYRMDITVTERGDDGQQ